MEVQSSAANASFVATWDTTFEKCMQAINCKMKEEMMSDTTMDSTNKVGVFMQQMIPHHANAVNMARILLTQVDAATIESAIEEGGLTDLLNDIITCRTSRFTSSATIWAAWGYFPVRALYRYYR